MSTNADWDAVPTALHYRYTWIKLAPSASVRLSFPVQAGPVTAQSLSTPITLGVGGIFFSTAAGTSEVGESLFIEGTQDISSAPLQLFALPRPLGTSLGDALAWAANNPDKFVGAVHKELMVTILG